MQVTVSVCLWMRNSVSSPQYQPSYSQLSAVSPVCQWRLKKKLVFTCCGDQAVVKIWVSAFHAKNKWTEGVVVKALDYVCLTRSHMLLIASHCLCLRWHRHMFSNFLIQAGNECINQRWSQSRKLFKIFMKDFICCPGVLHCTRWSVISIELNGLRCFGPVFETRKSIKILQGCLRAYINGF